MHRRRNLANSVVPTLLARGSRVAFHATMCRAEGDLEAYWNRILTIFDPYTFSHSQGQIQPSDPYEELLRQVRLPSDHLLNRRGGADIWSVPLAAVSRCSELSYETGQWLIRGLRPESKTAWGHPTYRP